MFHLLYNISNLFVILQKNQQKHFLGVGRTTASLTKTSKLFDLKKNNLKVELLIANQPN